LLQAAHFAFSRIAFTTAPNDPCAPAGQGDDRRRGRRFPRIDLLREHLGRRPATYASLGKVALLEAQKPHAPPGPRCSSFASVKTRCTHR
jgi:hypothetical protein